MTRREIAKRSLERKLKKREQQFDKVWIGTVNDVNEYLEKNEPVSDIGEFKRSVESFIDSLSFSGAWIHDRLTGHSGVPHSSRYRGSLTEKIRKALGYKPLKLKL